MALTLPIVLHVHSSAPQGGGGGALSMARLLRQGAGSSVSPPQLSPDTQVPQAGCARRSVCPRRTAVVSLLSKHFACFFFLFLIVLYRAQSGDRGTMPSPQHWERPGHSCCYPRPKAVSRRLLWPLASALPCPAPRTSQGMELWALGPCLSGTPGGSIPMTQ